MAILSCSSSCNDVSAFHYIYFHRYIPLFGPFEVFGVENASLCLNVGASLKVTFYSGQWAM